MAVSEHMPASRLQGQLISESGTMSGGGGKPKGGRIRLGNSAPAGGGDAKAAAAGAGVYVCVGGGGGEPWRAAGGVVVGWRLQKQQ